MKRKERTVDEVFEISSGDENDDSSDETVEVIDCKKSKKEANDSSEASTGELSASQISCVQQAVKYCSEQFNIFKKDDFTASYGLFLNSLLEGLVKTREYRMVRPVDGFSHRLPKLLSGEHLTLLPNNVISRIFSFLPSMNILIYRTDTVCSMWCFEMMSIWKRITKRIAPNINVDKYKTETLKEYCLAKKRAFYRQQKESLRYVNLELQAEEYPPSYEYDPITKCEIMTQSNNCGWKDSTFLVGGSGRYYDAFRSCEPVTYVFAQFEEVNGYYFNLDAPYYIYFTYDCKYEIEVERETSLSCDLHVFANDDEGDEDDDFISPIDTNEIDLEEVKFICRWLGMQDDIKNWNSDQLYDWFTDFLIEIFPEAFSDVDDWIDLFSKKQKHKKKR